MSTPSLPAIQAITYGGYTLDIDYYLNAVYDDVSQASQELPLAIEWLNSMLQYYVSAEVVEYRAIKQAEAEVYFDLRNGKFAVLYGEKMTEKALEMAVELDERVKTAVNAYAESKAWVTRLRNQIAVFTAKLDIVRTVEATRRHVDRSTLPPE